uniref:PLDc N-terminal domain-containing protein n=1 Tax=Pedobacter schmidteae TaxID=2201271 RepID=UPI000EB3AC52
MGYIILIVLLLVYIIYGIVHIKNNKALNLSQKLTWIAIVICLPVLGVSIYLRTTFVPRRQPSDKVD